MRRDDDANHKASPIKPITVTIIKEIPSHIKITGLAEYVRVTAANTVENQRKKAIKRQTRKTRM